ncbi:electron carrier/ protein disulfide oxidoreductase [Arabidopsis thaliana]|uniref:Electron carrier/ protein disulfide oxidoreductase n=2 Tax=Arabidopsis thaliana TaxID=3702 RepID=F4JIA7_ARATH|nr:electron carrier/ protein disulfide oxidoreductase [Arabidopsis thaliana]AEE82656.1 electron carrier/ protein disulfide oxidoreductase [Arabidopsis thaliana]|eukprot:NP_192595.4 electron carrier/ protein disulfide oxidoreductase [Arabidopsis thaliana]
MESSPKQQNTEEERKSAEIIAKEVSPKQQNVEEERKSAEIIAKEVSPKHNVEKKEEEFTRKPVVEIEEEEEEMESIDIHEEEEGDNNVSLDEIMSVDSSDDDDDSESSAEITKACEETVVDERSGISQESNSSTSSAWTEKAAAIKNFVRAKSEVAVHTMIRRLSGKLSIDNAAHGTKDDEVESPKTEGKSLWNPLSYLKMMQNDEDLVYREEETVFEPVVMKGRIILYTRLGCEECRGCRLFLHEKRLRYVEINIDIYPTRKVELEKISGGDVVPMVFFNEKLVGSYKELKVLEESGELEEKIKHLIEETPPREAPLPPFSGEDDASSKGPVDELALIVLKMKPCVVKDRFYKMRRFKNCFLGSEAVDFLSADQRLERDGPRPIVEIASRLRLVYRAILEAYTSPDGKHVDYRSIHGSEEFARYLRIIQELHRVELEDMQREEKLAFFINLYNMMAIHSILVWGHPAGTFDRTKMFMDFKYVIGGYTYSLSAIQNGILRGNQRPMFNPMKPFGVKDKRSKVALPYAEPLTHFTLVCGTRSGPPLRCFTPGEIDKELMEAARDFLRCGGLRVDLNAKVAEISKIFDWYGVDFGNGKEEILKHASTFLEPQLSEALLDCLVDTQFEVKYQPYDWGLNN